VLEPAKRFHVEVPMFECVTALPAGGASFYGETYRSPNGRLPTSATVEPSRQQLHGRLTAGLQTILRLMSTRA